MQLRHKNYLLRTTALGQIIKSQSGWSDVTALHYGYRNRECGELSSFDNR